MKKLIDFKKEFNKCDGKDELKILFKNVENSLKGNTKEKFYAFCMKNLDSLIEKLNKIS